ncbi:MAG: SDR family oxidoreductase [Acidimicrobiia bacterium]|nr:SDR family oxidoreductase [Acidimicrobiia bacterium]
MSTAVVTGAAGGIGQAICAALHRRSFYVVGCDREPRAEQTDAFYSVDVASESEVRKAVRAIAGRGEPIELLVTAAGIGGSIALAELTDARWDRVLSVNLTGTVLFCREVVPYMRDAPSGRIVTIASELGLSGAACYSDYCASKSAVIELSRALAYELAPTGIAVNCVAPGPTNTPMVGPDERSPAHMESLPLRRLSTPAEIAEAVAFLGTNDGSGLSGGLISPNSGAVI